MATNIPIITVKCRHCGYTAKRRHSNAYTGHSFDCDFSYVCPSCNANLDIVEENLDSDVKTTDPVTALEAFKKGFKLDDIPDDVVGPRYEKHDTLEANLQWMIDTLRSISVNRPDDVEHLDFQLAVNNAKWELIRAIKAARELYKGGQQ